ncbi:hypothetical protein CHS0354_029777 [Potamilus streckersoni]|uniref:Centromere protein L n=1 Tax=Potamilus streckersoni TaxID=2493646 RepID=A0AAE0TH57_9BIVA|nr:hypothetical protein CHS0354_029777 [Potamilus streckersoni]
MASRNSLQTPECQTTYTRIGSCFAPRATPKSCNIARIAPILSRQVSGEEEENIKALLNKTWHVFGLSPLYNFERKSSAFQRYSKSLSSALEAESHKGCFVDNDVPGSVEIGGIRGLTVNIGDQNAVGIFVRGKNRKAEDAMVYTALFCCVNLQFCPIPKDLQASFKYFPIMLASGPVAIMNSINNWLESQFDCRVTKLKFSSNDLLWMASLWSAYTPVPKSRPLELVYAVPQECEGLSKITYRMAAADAKRLLDIVHPDDSDELTEEEVQAYFDALESHLCYMFHAKLGTMYLRTVGNSIAYVSTDGKIKLFSMDYVFNVLAHLTQLSVERFTGTSLQTLPFSQNE